MELCAPAPGGNSLEDRTPGAEGVRPEGLMELPASFGELLAFFCTHATTHGALRLLCWRQNRLRAACWALLLLGALGVLCCQFRTLFQDYWRYPTAATVSVRSEPRHFPAVTLCDMNPQWPGPLQAHLQALDKLAQENIFSLYKFNLSKAGGDPSARWPGLEPTFPLGNGTRLQRLSQLGSLGRVGFRLCNSSGGDCFYHAFPSGLAAVQDWYRFHQLSIPAQPLRAQRASHADRFVLSCHYDGRSCHTRHVDTHQHPTFGSCYTFRGMRSLRHPSLAYGLSLVVRAEPQLHIPELVAEAGLKILVHRQDRSPFLEHQSFSIRPGTQTTIAVREVQLHRLGNPYSRCMAGSGPEDEEDPGQTLLYKGSYSRQACLASCFQQLMVNVCACAVSLHPLPAGAEYCSFPRHPAWGHCFYRLHRDLEDHKLPCTARCPRPCRDSAYTLSARTSRWPSAKSAAWMLAVLGEPRSDGTPGPRSVARVRVYHQELRHHLVQETPVYSVPRLLSAMGSLWGLWFGSSVLSVLELLELLLDATALAMLLSCRYLRTVLGARAQDPGQARGLHPSSCDSEGQRPAGLSHSPAGGTLAVNSEQRAAPDSTHLGPRETGQDGEHLPGKHLGGHRSGSLVPHMHLAQPGQLSSKRAKECAPGEHNCRSPHSPART